MLLHEKIAWIRKSKGLTQEEFAEKLNVSRQAVSKWENQTAVPELSLLIAIADLGGMTLDQLTRDGTPPPSSEAPPTRGTERYLGKVCDVTMNSARHGVLRNIKIVGTFRELVCFERNGRYGWFNADKTLGIVVKREEPYVPQNELQPGKCSVYANKGTYLGGMTFVLSSLERVTEEGIVVRTGKFETLVPFNEVSVILMKEKYSRRL